MASLRHGAVHRDPDKRFAEITARAAPAAWRAPEGLRFVVHPQSPPYIVITRRSWPPAAPPQRRGLPAPPVAPGVFGPRPDQRTQPPGERSGAVLKGVGQSLYRGLTDKDIALAGEVGAGDMPDQSRGRGQPVKGGGIALADHDADLPVLPALVHRQERGERLPRL
jgi:hypothetical protein